MNKIILIFIALIMSACTGYTTPPRETWGARLRGASRGEMTADAKIAKRPVYLGAGGRMMMDAIARDAAGDYGDKAANDNMAAVAYMSELEYALYDALRKPGISVQRAGTDVVVILVRDAIMELDVAEISPTGADTLNTIANILRKYDATFIEIAGYTDAMRDAHAAHALSDDMAMRTAVFMTGHKIIPQRIFIIGRGAARPIAAQDDIGRLTNRRVEIRIAPAR